MQKPGRIIFEINRPSTQGLMQRLIATIRKEMLLLIRDRSGLAVMFLMPMALVTIMALIQDAPFRDYQELKIPLLLINNDNGDLGKQIEEGLSESKIFLVTRFNGTETAARKEVFNGTFEIGIIVPADASEKLRSRVDQFVAETMQTMGILESDSMQKDIVVYETTIPVFFAPDIKKSFKNSVLSSVQHVSSRLETQTLLLAFKHAVNEGEAAVSNEKIDDFIQFRETGGNEIAAQHELNSVQHNVPAWTLFGMFFIVISLAGSMIKERTDGSYLRIRTMPGSYLTVIAGKVIAYLVVCLSQCLLMILAGIYLMPLLGLPQLEIGSNLPAVVIVAVCCGLAATGYGVLIGTFFNTHQQSSTFGSVSVVILAALGGIWVPVYVMPEIIRVLAAFSPLYWGLNAFQTVFLGSGNSVDIGIYAIKLLLFFIFTLSIATLINKYKNN